MDLKASDDCQMRDSRDKDPPWPSWKSYDSRSWVFGV